MSFSSDVRDEIAGISGEDRHCRISEMAAIINSCATIKVNDNKLNLVIKTDNKHVYDKAFYIIKNDFKYEAEPVRAANETNSNKNSPNNLFVIDIDDQNIAQKLLWSTGILDNHTNMVKFKIDNLVTKSVCCKRAYIRSAFLSNGSISNPEKSYHLEFVFSDEKYANDFSGVINYFGLNSKVIARKDNFVVYLKEGEQIVDILNIMGAHNSLLHFENLRVTKEVMNNINRKVNFQSANLNKTIDASVKQVEDIRLVKDTKGLSYLPAHLEELARLRLEYPEITLKELAEKLSMPISKSGANHRLKKISEIAQQIRENG